jgi:lysosomal Pro-X carboxypeptidase
MATGFISLLFSLLSLLFFGISSFAKPIPSFPSSIIQAEKISLSTPNELYHEKFFTQVLDHYTFRPQSYKTFQQRYLINDKYWGGAEKNAPIFLYTGNEGDIEWFAQNTGFIFDIAPHFKPLLVFIEVII